MIAPAEMSPDFTDTARAALLWVLWHHQGGSSPVGQPIRYALGMDAHEHLSKHQVQEAKRWAALTKSESNDFRQARTAPPEPVNARLLEALNGLMALSDHRVDLRDAAKAARAAIARAEAALAEPQPDAESAMTRADVLRLALKAGFTWEPINNIADPLESFAALVMKAKDGPWKSAVIDQLIIAHTITAEHENDPLKAVQDLLAYHADIAVDPRVSGAAAKLVEQAKAEEREACLRCYSPDDTATDWADRIRARGQK